MKRLALAMGLLTCASAAQAQSPANWTQPIEPFQIADNL